MTKFSKAHWVAEEDTIRMSMDFSKVNKEKRLVSGFATLDNVDTQNDIVTAEASRKAFARARGNLREMHKKDSAVGHIVSFKEDEFRAPDGKKYRGIFVTAYISKGAQDTWEKVLDKTLTGFSIGGNVIDFEEDFSKDANSTVRVIKDYDLTELSLVDNPANQLANVFTIHKVSDGSVTVTGMAAETDILNVFFCETDRITQEKPDDSATCPVCTEKMSNIGWIEDGSDRDEKVNTMVTKYMAPSDALSKGGEEMSNKFTKFIKSEKVSEEPDTTDETVETGHEEGDPTEVPSPTRTDDGEFNEVDVETDPEAADVDEVHDEGEEIAKKIDELKTVVSDSLEKTRDETRKQVESLEKQITQLDESFKTKASEFERKFAELDENLEVTKGRLSGFEKKLEKMNASDAFRKSADFEESVETVQESDTTWNGAFSVKNLLR